MILAAGARLGPYEILGPIGAGGMGEVYSARDTRLDRTVAIKILRPELSADPVRRARFEREARTVAGVTHPHIGALYDIGEHAGSTFLVMEHLEGETLAHRLDKGALPLDKALTIAAEIAEALSAAHRHGIVHRDLKPGNVMLTREGAKLLDFGLAKLIDHADDTAAQAASMPTRSSPLTVEGTILGTLQYMAPEQIEGRATDERTDLWALGAILYEMVSGQRAFEATSTASLIGAILEREPEPLVTRQPLTPRGVDAIVRDCLAKAAGGRPDTAHDLARELRLLADTSPTATPVSVTSGRGATLRAAVLVIGCGALIAVPVFLLSRFGHEKPPAPLVRSELGVAPAAELNAGGATSTSLLTAGGSRTAIAWTSDGQSLVFVGRREGTQQLYVRALDSAEARPLVGTEGAQLPVVSATGQSVAFWSRGALKQVPLGGGPVMELVSGIPVPPKGMVADDRGRLFFDKAETAVKQNEAVWAVQPGGIATPITSLRDVERSHVPSSVLPGDRTLLYTARKRIWTWGDEDVVAHDLVTGQSKVLVHDAVDGRYVPTGHLVFLRRGMLFAVPFDAGRVEVTGAPVPILEGVAQALVGTNVDDVTGAGQFAIAGSGSLAWIPGTMAALQKVLVAVDRRGRVSTLGSPERNYGAGVRLSPDATQLATTVRDLGAQGLWLFDLARGVLTPLQRQGETYATVWSADGRQVFFEWLDGGRPSLVVKSTAESPRERVLASGEFEPSCWAPGGDLLGVLDGRRVAVAFIESQHSRIEPLLRTSDIERWPEISPDGRWLAYGSNASGRFEIYIQPYPGPGSRTVVSTDGGESPAWGSGGRELLFLSSTPAGNGRMMTTAFEPGSPPRVGTPRPLFEFDPTDLRFSCTQVRCYDVSRDGERFYATRTRTAPPATTVTRINLVQNWFEELNAKVRARK